MDYNLPDSSVNDFPGKNIGAGLPFPSLGDLPIPGIKPGFPALEADSLLPEPPTIYLVNHFKFPSHYYFTRGSVTHSVM